MAVPKKRTSSRKTKMRRSHDALKRTSLIQCPACGEPVEPHRACGSCGAYKGKQVLPIEG